ncbi:MAG: AAA family ATPase [Solibacillus sp.]
MTKTQEDFPKVLLPAADLPDWILDSSDAAHFEEASGVTDEKAGASEVELATTPYEQWLAGDGKQIVAQLAAAYEKDTLTIELNAKFVKQFKRFLNGSLLMKVKRKQRQIEVTLVELTANGYREMRHPFLQRSWEISKPIHLVPNADDFQVGDIVSTHQFDEMRNTAYLTSILFLHLDDAKVVPQTLQQALGELVQPAFFEELVSTGLEDSVEAVVVRTLVRRNSELKQQLQVALDEQLQLARDVEQEKLDLEQEKLALSEEQRKWTETIAFMEKLMEEDAEQEQEDEIELLPYDSKKFIQDLQKLYFHNNEFKSLMYDETLIRKFFYSLQANILTVLSGPSGTGKSSIIESLADCVENVKVKMISVQSSWTDATDLLGYFHPNDKTFVPTPFMEALVDAAKNPHEIHIVCLDEMNLAHVEYYFSEILSAREKKKPSIYLYPKKHQQMAKLILLDDTASLERKRNATELVKLYEPEFIIPENVRFVGTLNMDHTVKPLSPKVVDRSFIIEVNHLSLDDKKALKKRLEKTKLTGKIRYDYAQFKEKRLEEKDYKKLVTEIEELCELLEPYPNAALNSRGYKHIQAFLSFAESPTIAKSLVDSIVYSKVLPRIEVKRAMVEEDIPRITTKLAGYAQSSEKWATMLQKPYTVSFW